MDQQAQHTEPETNLFTSTQLSGQPEKKYRKYSRDASGKKIEREREVPRKRKQFKLFEINCLVALLCIFFITTSSNKILQGCPILILQT